MIQILDKKNCCGCAACVQKCPKQCITMHEDEEGFLYPKVDETVCIDCHLCEKVCPVINPGEPREPLVCYAAKNPNEEIRMQSSSGGIFTMIAEVVIDEGGVVFGAGFNERWQVVHSYTETKEGLVAYRGSKYVQSVIGNTFKEAESFLKAGRKVLFSGTPCQIAGLKKYLRNDYDNLLAVDFICHGVPSPGVFRWYLQEELNNYAARKDSGKNSVSFSQPITSIPKGDVLVPEGLSIEDIWFRDKREGWKKFSFVLRLAEVTVDGKKNSVSISAKHTKHPYLMGFIKNIYLRPSCHHCSSRCLKSGSDITIADCWHTGSLPKGYDDDKGTSSVLVNSNRGQKVIMQFNDIMKNSTWDEITKYNFPVIESCIENSRSYEFWADKKTSFIVRTNKLLKPTMKERFYILVNIPKRLIAKIKSLY